jgi:hypothetical protein
MTSTLENKERLYNLFTHGTRDECQNLLQISLIPKSSFFIPIYHCCHCSPECYLKPLKMYAKVMSNHALQSDQKLWVNNNFIIKAACYCDVPHIVSSALLK